MAVPTAHQFGGMATGKGAPLPNNRLIINMTDPFAIDQAAGFTIVTGAAGKLINRREEN